MLCRFFNRLFTPPLAIRTFHHLSRVATTIACHIISIRTRSGALHAPSAPVQGKSSHSGRYHQRNRSREGMSLELLIHHHPHGIQRSRRANLPSISRESLTANTDPPTTSSNQPSHHITRHICNNDGSKYKQAGRQYNSASTELCDWSEVVSIKTIMAQTIACIT